MSDSGIEDMSETNGTGVEQLGSGFYKPLNFKLNLSHVAKPRSRPFDYTRVWTVPLYETPKPSTPPQKPRNYFQQRVEGSP